MSKLVNYAIAVTSGLAVMALSHGCGHLFSREATVRTAIVAADQAVSGAERAVEAQCDVLPKCEEIRGVLVTIDVALTRAKLAVRDENFSEAKRLLGEAKDAWASLRALGFAFVGELPETPADAGAK